MESQPQNPEFWINPENFQPYEYESKLWLIEGFFKVGLILIIYNEHEPNQQVELI